MHIQNCEYKNITDKRKAFLLTVVCILSLSLPICAMGMESVSEFDLNGARIMEALEKNQDQGEQINTGIIFDTREKAEEFGGYFYRECYLGDENMLLGTRPVRHGSGSCEIVVLVRNPVKAVVQHRRAQAVLRETAEQNKAGDAYGTALNLYQWLYDHVQYDDTKKHYSVYSAVVGGSTVCYGYARAYRYLCMYSGLECELVYGDNHVWNRVKIDGEWKYVDITWNRSLGEHRWMFLTEDEMGSHS